MLLDNYEPNMKTADVRQIFDQLKEELVPLIQEIGDAGDVDDSFLHQAFDQGGQRAFSLEVLRRFGYTDDEWRIDQTQHPFMTSPGHGDIRLTTNFRPDDLSSLFATMHEFGHGVYEWGVDRSLARAGEDVKARDARVCLRRALAVRGPGKARTSLPSAAARRQRSGVAAARGYARRHRGAECPVRGRVRSERRPATPPRR